MRGMGERTNQGYDMSRSLPRLTPASGGVACLQTRVARARLLSQEQGSLFPDPRIELPSEELRELPMACIVEVGRMAAVLVVLQREALR